MKKILMIMAMAATVAACDGKRTNDDMDDDAMEMDGADHMDDDSDMQDADKNTSTNGTAKYDHTKKYTLEGTPVQRKEALLAISTDLDANIVKVQTARTITDEDALEKLEEAKEKIGEAREKLVKADEKSADGKTEDAMEKVEKALEKLEEAREKYAEAWEKQREADNNN